MPAGAEMTASTRSFGESLNTWVQTLAILAAGGWAVYTFVFKEIWAPNAAPINVSLTMEIGDGGRKAISGKSLRAIELNVSATNPSSRTVHLMPSVWQAIGYNVGVAQAPESFAKRLLGILGTGATKYEQRYAGAVRSEILAGGRLVPDSILQPSETVHRRLVFYVPDDRFDSLEVITAIYSTVSPEKAAVTWDVEPSGGFKPIIYRLDDKGGRTLVSNEEMSEMIGAKDVGLQLTAASHEQSLWRSGER